MPSAWSRSPEPASLSPTSMVAGWPTCRPSGDPSSVPSRGDQRLLMPRLPGWSRTGWYAEPGWCHTVGGEATSRWPRLVHRRGSSVATTAAKADRGSRPRDLPIAAPIIGVRTLRDVLTGREVQVLLIQMGMDRSMPINVHPGRPESTGR